MLPALPHRPPLAMRLWLFRSFGRKGGTGSAAPGRSSGRTMSIESLEHMVRSRVRLFLRHTWLVAILGTIILGAAVWAAIYLTAEADHMRIAAGPRDVRFVQALSDRLTKQHPLLHLQLVPTAGAMASAEAMSKDQADFAILPSNLDDSLNWPVVAILRQNVMALIVPAPGATKKGKKSVKIEKVAQLSGRRVGIVTGSEATVGLLDLVLSHYGVALAKVTVSEIDPNNLAGAIKNNQVDVLFVAGAATGQAISSAVAAASQNGDAPTFVAIDQADGIAKRNPAFDSVDIDAGTFGGNPPTPDDSLKSLSFAEHLVARKSFSDSSVATLAKVLYSSRQSLAIAMPGEMKIEAPSTDKDAAVVSHPGALAYLSDSQQSFFDKYGDDIFYGLLIFPIFGSAIAGVASYLRSGSHTRRLRLLQRVLDLVRKAHAAQTLEAIEHLQVEADNLVIAIIHQSEHEEFDETVRMSFAFALDQLRFTIAARRTAILDHAGTGTGAGATAAAA
jgi:TRAP transporter TAXI family solute receptor